MLRAGHAIWVGNGGVETAERRAIWAAELARGAGTGSRGGRWAGVPGCAPCPAHSRPQPPSPIPPLFLSFP